MTSRGYSKARLLELLSEETSLILKLLMLRKGKGVGLRGGALLVSGLTDNLLIYLNYKDLMNHSLKSKKNLIISLEGLSFHYKFYKVIKP